MRSTRLILGSTLLLAALAPSPAAAAVATHTYQITGGTSSGFLNIGTVTGGSFTVQYPSTPCNPCNGALAPSLLSGSISGTAGMMPLTPGFFSQQGGRHTGSIRRGNWSFILSFANFPFSNGFTRGSFAFEHFTASNYMRGGRFSSYYRHLFYSTAFGGALGGLSFTGYEVSVVPEPAPAALLTAGALVLGAHLLRRARRRLV